MKPYWRKTNTVLFMYIFTKVNNFSILKIKQRKIFNKNSVILIKNIA